MKKADYVATVAKKANVTRTQAEFTIACLFELITETLEVGEPFLVTGFGTFKPVDKPKKLWRHPTGKEMEVGGRSVKFIASDILKRRVKDGAKEE